MPQTQNPCCLILGATSDIGEAIAYEYARHGYDLLLAARNAGERLAPLAGDLQIRHQVTARTVDFDGADFPSHEHFYGQLPAEPSVVVSVFGYLGKQETAQQDFAEAERIITANFTGHVSILNTVANEFEARGNGAIIGISSVAGDRGRGSNYLYGSSKAAFSAYLSGLRNRLAAAGVQVLTVKPGFVNTQMTAGLDLPPRLTAQPEQVAKAVYRAMERKKNVIYTLPVWRLVMLVIRNIPEGIFKKLKL